MEIWYFIAQDDPVAADRLLDLLEEKHKLLADNPHMGSARPDIAKELRYHPWAIICCFSDGVEILMAMTAVAARGTNPAMRYELSRSHRSCLS